MRLRPDSNSLFWQRAVVTRPWLAMGAVVAMASCGGSAAPAFRCPTSMEPSTWVAGLTCAYCAAAVRCGQYSNATFCEGVLGPEFADDNFNMPSAAVKAVLKGTAQFDAQAAAACLSAVSQLDCANLGFPTAVLNVPPSCATVFSGSTQEGGACIDDVECVAGTSCLLSSDSPCEATCVANSATNCRSDADCPPQQVCEGVGLGGAGLGFSFASCEAVTVPLGTSEGDACGWPAGCAAGLTCQCSEMAGGGCSCVTNSGPGGNCGQYGPVEFPSCLSGLACVPPPDGAPNSCMSPANLGNACTSLFQCGAQYLASDTICDETHTHACIAKPSSGSCVVVYGMNTCDPVVSYCDGSTGTCVPWLPLGKPCAMTSNGINPCGPWNTCSRVCVTLDTCTPD